MVVFNVDQEKMGLFKNSQKGVAAPYLLGDVIVDPNGIVGILVQGFGEDNPIYRSDVGGKQPYEGTRFATEEEIVLHRSTMWENGNKEENGFYLTKRTV